MVGAEEGEHLAGVSLGQADGVNGDPDGLLRRAPPGAGPLGSVDGVPVGQPDRCAQVEGTGFEGGDLVQAGLVDLLSGKGKRGVQPDEALVVLVAAGNVHETSPIGGTGPGQEIPDGLGPPADRRLQNLGGDAVPLLDPIVGSGPAGGRLRGRQRGRDRRRHETLGPLDGVGRQRSDGQSPLRGAGSETLAELVDVVATPRQPGQVGDGRVGVGRNRAGCHGEELGRRRERLRGHGVLGTSRVDDGDLLVDERGDATKGHAIGGRRGPNLEGRGLGQKLLHVGPAPRLAGLAGVGHQIVIAGYTHIAGLERIGPIQCGIQAVGQLAGSTHPAHASGGPRSLFSVWEKAR